MPSQFHRNDKNPISPIHTRISFQTLRFLLGAVVDHNILFRSAGDGVVMLEEADRSPRIHQQRIVWDRVASFHPSMPSVGNRQAVEDLCPPGRRPTNSYRPGCLLLCRPLNWSLAFGSKVISHSSFAGQYKWEYMWSCTESRFNVEIWL